MNMEFKPSIQQHHYTNWIFFLFVLSLFIWHPYIFCVGFKIQGFTLYCSIYFLIIKMFQKTFAELGCIA